MADAFTDALADLKDALTNGEDVDAAIMTVAADHEIRPEALRNRATKAWGDLVAYGTKNREREVEATARAREADAIALARKAMSKPQKEWGEWSEEERKAFDVAHRTDRFWRS